MSSSRKLANVSNAVRISLQEVHSADYRVDGAATGDQPHVVQRVHNARVSAAQQDHDAVTGIEEHRLVIDEGIALIRYNSHQGKTPRRHPQTGSYEESLP